MAERALRPGAIGALRLPHRIVMGSMHLGLEARDDGGAALAAFYAERAANGAGLIITGGSAVSRTGAGGRNYSFVNDDADAPKLARVARTVREAGGSVALQLFHAGRYAFEEAFGLQPVAPSAIPSRFSRATPRALDHDEILATIGDFARGAARARALGFAAVEIMASEGYLINQFLSPLTNRRDDAWGGDAERRMRFGLAVLAAVREAVGAAFPVIVRMSGADLMDGSSTPDETLAFAGALAAGGADALNVGIGWHESAVPTVQGLVAPAHWVPYAKAVKRAVGPLPVIASNRIASVALADRILGETALDFVAMARPFLADAALVRKAREGGAATNPCIACNQACIDRALIDADVSCMTNPRAGRELEFPARRAARPRRVAVAGGGPAGLEAARALATLGARVELFDAAGELGGQFRLARRIPGKEPYGETIAYFARELERLGVAVRLGRALGEGDAELLRAFDAVVVATGVRPRRATLPGAELPHVVGYAEAIAAPERLGRRVAIVGGGGIAVDVAHLLAHDGDREVTVMRRGGPIGARIGRSTRWAVLGALRARGVRLLTGIAYEDIVAGGVRIRDARGEPELVGADHVVVAVGQEPCDPLGALLRRLEVPHAVVGGAHDATELDAVRAFDEGLRAAYALLATFASQVRS